MKSTQTLTEFDKTIQRLKSLANCGVLHHEESRPINHLARKALAAFMAFIVPEYDENGTAKKGTTTVEDFIEATKNNQFHIEKLMKEAFDTARGNAAMHQYRLKELMVSDESLVDFSRKEQKVYREKIDFLYTPILIDLARIEKLYKFLNRSVEGYVFDLAHVFPETKKIQHRDMEVERSPYQDFLDLEFDGFIFTDKEEYDATILADENPADAETKAIQGAKVLNSIANKK